MARGSSDDPSPIGGHGAARPLPAQRARAVLDTSAWTAASRAEVSANLLDLFRLVAPRAVADEILARDPAFPGREYPYATLFRQLVPRMTMMQADRAPPPLAVFGPGEAAALALAQQRAAEGAGTEVVRVTFSLRCIRIASDVYCAHETLADLHRGRRG